MQVAIFKRSGTAVSPFKTLFDSSQLAATPAFDRQADFGTPRVDMEIRQVCCFALLYFALRPVAFAAASWQCFLKI